MGGVVCRVDTSTELPRPVRGRRGRRRRARGQRLGGNGVANSTVFGGIAGEDDGGLGRSANGGAREPDEDVIASGLERARRSGARAATSRRAERPLRAMWDDVGMLRMRAGLSRAQATLDALEGDIAGMGAGPADRAFNLTFWNDENLENLVAREPSDLAAALTREDSRGAHFREDFPQTSELSTCELHGRAMGGRGDLDHDGAGPFHARAAGRNPAARGGGVASYLSCNFAGEVGPRDPRVYSEGSEPVEGAAGAEISERLHLVFAPEARLLQSP